MFRKILGAFGVLAVVAAGMLYVNANSHRCKGSARVEGEIRTLVVALEGYKEDCGTYPRNAATDALDNQTNFNPAEYAAASQFLYRTLTGDSSPSRHRFGGFGFVRDGREFAHVHGNGLLDVKLTRERATQIVTAGRAEAHHVFGPSAWISFQLRTREDCEAALTLLNVAMAANPHVSTLHRKVEATYSA